MPESVCLSMILGDALGRSFSPSSNSSWSICFTNPCGSRHKPNVDECAMARYFQVSTSCTGPRRVRALAVLPSMSRSHEQFRLCESSGELRKAWQLVVHGFLELLGQKMGVMPARHPS